MINTDDKKEIVLVRDAKFEDLEEKLKETFDNIPQNTEFTSFKTKGFLGFNYHTTGEDVNMFSGEVKDKFISYNKTIAQLYDTDKEIYYLIRALNEQYIQKILISQKSAEEANKNAKKTMDKLEREQNVIKGIIKEQQRIVNGLSQFKARLEKIEHLSDIDKSFKGISEIKKNIEDIVEQIEIQESTIDNLSKSLKIMKIIYIISMVLIFIFLIIMLGGVL